MRYFHFFTIAVFAAGCLGNPRSPAKDSGNGVCGDREVKPEARSAAGAGSDGAAKAHASLLQIICFSPHAPWTAEIRGDGSGTIGFGSGLGVPFPPGTFDMAMVRAALRPKLISQRRAEPRAESYAVDIFGEHGTESFGVDDANAIAEVFELFRTACRRGNRTPNSDRLVEDTWWQPPPTPVSRSWDDNGKGPVLRVSAIRIAGMSRAQTEWTAVVKADGSGYGGYLTPTGASFPPGTFDVGAIVTRLRPQLSPQNPLLEPGGNLYAATFISEAVKETMYAKEPDAIAEVFEKLRRACRERRDEGSMPFEVAWRAHPPTPASKAWDAP